MAPPRPPSFVPHPLALLTASFALGILGARLTVLPLTVCVAGGAVCTLLSVYCHVRHRRGLTTLLIVLAFFYVGATLAVLEKRAVTRDRVARLYEDGVIASGDPVEVTGGLERAPEPAPDGFYLTLRADRIRVKEAERAASGTVWLFAPVRDDAARAAYEALELHYGARLRVMAALRRAEGFRNPGVSSFTEYLERRGFDALGTIKSPLLVERLDDERVFLPLAWVYEWRRRLLAEAGRNFSAGTAGVLKAALLGNRYHLSREVAERFREGGTFHVLVISGLHISFIGGLALALARRVTKRRAWQFAASVTFLWAYTLAVGAEPAVARAALMFTVVALAPVLHRRADSLNALGGAGLLLLVWRPGDLFDPSLQLTFLSVLMIVAVAWPLLQRAAAVGKWRPTRETPYPPLCPRWWRALSETLFWGERRWRREMARSTWSCSLFKAPAAARLERLHVQRLLRYAVGAAVVSASVQVGLVPVLVLYFHRLSVAAFVLNIGVGALMAVLSLVALAAIAASQLSPALAAPLVSLAERVNWLMVHSVDPFASAGIASVRLPEYTGWMASVYALYYAPLAVLAVALARWNPLRQESEQGDSVSRPIPRVAAVAFAALLVVIVSHPLSAGRPDARLRLDFLDVGQGDAALVTMPDGTTLLIDAGGRPSFGTRADEEGDAEAFERDARGIGEAVVSEYLWWRGLDSIDYVLATHAHADHIDGLNDVVRNFKVRAAFVARAPAHDPASMRFAATADRYGVPLHLVGRGDVLRFGGIEAHVLWPALTADVDAPSGNDDSLVLRLRFGRRRFLLTGDIEGGAEAALVSAREDLRCDVVKVAHHGSKTSSTEAFVGATRPTWAIVSVGLSSIFGHPHAEVLERWRGSGAQILTTGRHGTITVSTDGHDLQVETFIKR